ncbi:alpha/beta hydrolase [Peribacillus simplex]|uniref:Alpha/beta hydrolase n=1 Tax=Peribacillus simplex TaxID=1478 RepID=A0A8B5Y504_9BACI|nr:alpha/beta hydrolase [Peribacillus simplex]TVX84126.1 alpha/beta hydrolase [Peribacillus simplex]
MKIKKALFLSLLMVGILAVATPLTSAADNKAKMLEVSIKEPSVNLVSDVVYSQQPIYGYSNVPLEMDILQPEGKKPLPAVVFVPGGGFMSANNDKSVQQRMSISEAGYVVASIEYRVTPQSTFPSPLEDVKAAIRYLRANAEKFNIDPENIVVMGSSAGGYLAAFAGTTNGLAEFDKGENLDQSSDVKAVIDLYGLSDLTRVGYGFSEEVQALHKSPSAPEGMWVNGPSVMSPGGSIFDNLEKAAKANPITYITKDAPPFLIMHGDKDALVSPNQTEILHENLINKGVDSTYYVVKGADHGGTHWVQPKVTKILINFLDKHVKGKENKNN